MKTLACNIMGGLGGFTFLAPVLDALKASGDTVHICDPNYSWLAVAAGIADAEQKDPLAVGYDRTLKPDMNRPDTLAEQCGVTVSTITKLVLPNALAKANLLVVIPFTQWGLWPLANWKALIQQLHNQENVFNGVLVITNHRSDMGGAKLADKSVTVSKDQPLQTLAPILASARAFLASEGGLGHLCGALGLPGVMFRRQGFLPQWKPKQPWVTTLEGVGDYGSITVAQAATAIKAVL